MLEVFIALILTSLACSSLGTILVIRNESMLTDALSHSVLLGIVLAFFVNPDLNSPLLIIGAALFALLTILLIDWINTSKKINHDSATGIIFPLLFSIAVILITMFVRNAHLDIDIVLMGEILFTSLNRTEIFGFSIAKSVLELAIILILNISFIGLNYYKLKVYLSDPTQAKLLGINTRVLKLISVVLVATTCIISFNSVGSIAVICFFVAPAMSSIFLTKNYFKMLVLSGLISVVNAIIGFFVALYMDINIAGITCFVSLINLLLIINISKIKIKFHK
ncbi:MULTISPECIES: metal ABC transporter permease [unclassified Gemella]|uniref:metal ABC transporter permease n=1 Tax=unclassified Gemella TaxID=2624949 RepID=UPI001C057406|nr:MULTISPECIES: metal ABC transporter permease [unclassified Gemella]MBU0278752.1 metal ABC transporter permease [Gemella sp. zg-1178]QWQ38692.1 metal ABC transporter permease [Gemella sp. zg-570]